jgi:DNA-binding IclR family transcriptional regulator
MLPEDRILSIIRSSKFTQHTPFAPSTSRQLLVKIRETKRLGYAVSMRERDLDTGGIAAPVFDDHGVIGSLAVIGPVDRMERNGIKKIGKQVRMIANELTGELVSSNMFILSGNGKVPRKHTMPCE